MFIKTGDGKIDKVLKKEDLTEEELKKANKMEKEKEKKN